MTSSAHRNCPRINELQPIWVDGSRGFKFGAMRPAFAGPARDGLDAMRLELERAEQRERRQRAPRVESEQAPLGDHTAKNERPWRGRPRRGFG
jgi:hypothetical protein